MVTDPADECSQLRKMKPDDVTNVVLIEGSSFGRSWAPETFQKLLKNRHIEI